MTLQAGGLAVVQTVRSTPRQDSQSFVRTPDFDGTTSPLSAAGYQFLEARGVPREVIDHNEIRTAHRSFKVDGEYKTLECVAIPFKRDGDVVNVKYRSLEGVLLLA